MADGLAAIIQGTDPTDAQQMQAYLQAQQAAIAQDPQKWQNLGPFGALAHAMAMGSAGPGAVQTVQGIVDRNQAAQPDLVKALAAPDPWSWAAANPNANPLAISRLTAAGPLGVAQARNAYADAIYRQSLAGLQGLQWQLRARALATPSGFVGGGQAGAPAAAAAPGAGAMPPAASYADLGTGRYPGGGGGAPGTGTDAGGGAALVRAMPPAGPARAAWIARLSPQQQQQLLGALRAPGATAAGTPGAPGPVAAPDLVPGMPAPTVKY